MELPEWIYIVLFFFGATAGASIKEGGHERIGGAIQYAVLGFMLWQAYVSKNAGNIDHAMAFSLGAGMMFMAIPWSNVALTHRRYAHKDEPDKSWAELREEFREELLSTVGALLFLALFVWGLIWIASRVFV
ncbi:MAG: hypothetical protein AMXMBFR67_20390 [Nitrospira sp.]